MSSPQSTPSSASATASVPANTSSTPSRQSSMPATPPAQSSVPATQHAHSSMPVTQHAHSSMPAASTILSNQALASSSAGVGWAKVLFYLMLAAALIWVCVLCGLVVGEHKDAKNLAIATFVVLPIVLILTVVFFNIDCGVAQRKVNLIAQLKPLPSQ